MKNNDFIKKNISRNALFFLILAVLVAFLIGNQNTYARFTDTTFGSDTSIVAKPILTLNCESDFYIEEQGYYRFSISNFEGTTLTQTPLKYEIRIVTDVGTIVAPSSLSIASSSDYSDNTILLNEATRVENGVYYYQDSSMKFGLSESTVYYELVFSGLNPGEATFDIEVYAEQSDN